MAAYQAACRDGVSPVDFWALTPYECRYAMAGLRDGRTTLAWQIAALQRQKKLPDLGKLLAREKDTATSLKAALSGFKRG